jgi:hypothetical protein
MPIASYKPAQNDCVLRNVQQRQEMRPVGPVPGARLIMSLQHEGAARSVALRQTLSKCSSVTGELIHSHDLRLLNMSTAH